MIPSSRVMVTALLVLLAGGRAAPGQAQSRDAAGGLGLRAARQALEQRAEQLELAARSGALAKDHRSDARREAAAIRARLVTGDFAVGDRVLLRVEGERELTDTFTVAPGRILALPLVGDVALAGVLRSELQDFLARRLAQNLRAPVVQARAFVRVSIQGAVARPGYYAVPAEALLSDALMAAGGTLQDANLKQLRIERDGQAIWQGEALARAIAEGRTVDEAGLVAGDQYVLPRRGHASVGGVLQTGAMVLGIPITIYTLTRIF
jgi:hypothetical protein